MGSFVWQHTSTLQPTGLSSRSGVRGQALRRSEVLQIGAQHGCGADDPAHQHTSLPPTVSLWAEDMCRHLNSQPLNLFDHGSSVTVQMHTH